MLDPLIFGMVRPEVLFLWNTNLYVSFGDKAHAASMDSLITGLLFFGMGGRSELSESFDSHLLDLVEFRSSILNHWGTTML